MSQQADAYAALPGHDLVMRGIQDLATGRETVDALLVGMAAPRLREVGLEIPAAHVSRPSHRLYDLLAESDPRDAHRRYNALLGRIASFARAAEHARSR